MHPMVIYRLCHDDLSRMLRNIRNSVLHAIKPQMGVLKLSTLVQVLYDNTDVDLRLNMG